MSKNKETGNTEEVKEVKKINKLAIKKETITDLNVPDSEHIKGGTITPPSPGTYTRCRASVLVA